MTRTAVHNLPQAPSRHARTTKTLLPAVATYAALTFVGLVTILPFIWVFLGSFKSSAEILNDPGRLLPADPTFDNFIHLVSSYGFAGYTVNSLVVAFMVVLSNILFSTMIGYALAKLDFTGKRILFLAVMGSLVVPFAAIFVSQFVVIVNLGLVNTLAGIALPLMVMPLAVFVVRQFALSVPDDLFEAARIDGAGEIRIFFRIFFPLSGPAIAVTAILTFLAAWNNFIWPLIVAQSQDMYTLPVGLATTQSIHTTDYGLLLAGAVVVMLPVLILFLFLQKYFVQGIATTGIK